MALFGGLFREKNAARSQIFKYQGSCDLQGFTKFVGFFKFCLILEGPMPLTSGIIIYSGRFCCTLFYIFGILQQS